MLSLALFVDSLEEVSPSLDAPRPGLLFRPPEYPGVLIEPAAHAPLAAGKPVEFSRGKSCLLAWPETEGGVLPLELYLVGLVDAPSTSRGVLLGAAVHSLRLEPVAAQVRSVRAQLKDVIGNTVAVLHARARLRSREASVAR